jgi:hypothetical protein
MPPDPEALQRNFDVAQAAWELAGEDGDPFFLDDCPDDLEED